MSGFERIIVCEILASDFTILYCSLDVVTKGSYPQRHVCIGLKFQQPLQGIFCMFGVFRDA